MASGNSDRKFFRQPLRWLTALLFCSSHASAQVDYSWWNAIHHWDGVTPWVQYMTMSPAFMGPNSLPVPELRDGLISKESELELAAGTHRSDGDRTNDAFTRLSITLPGERAALELFVVPIEYFKTDTLTRDTRAARTRSGKGSAGGDMYFNTQVQLLKNNGAWPDIAMELAFRTASGTDLRDARYTDGSGYYFDLSFSRKVLERDAGIVKELRFAAMGGFYSYQTYDLQHPQNDAALFGLGAELHTKKFLFTGNVEGYSGYLKIHDHPLVSRTAVSLKGKRIDWKVRYEWGLHDDPYRSLRIGAVWHFRLPVDSK